MPEETSGLDFERPILELENKINDLKNVVLSEKIVNFDLKDEILALEEKRNRLMEEIFSTLTPWQRVQLARHPKRPYTQDYIRGLFTDFIELHGDRYFSDDPALVGGMAFFEGQPVIVMGHQKGRSLEESVARNFGMMHPDGYRKALRLMKLAEKFHKPVIVFIDTAGAYPGIAAEERGQAEAIARNLREMAGLATPIISIVIGEGGSGGALGIGVSDRILMMENAWYSVISPEGCAAILFRDAARAPEAATALKLTAGDLLSRQIIDEIVPEPLGGAHRNFERVLKSLKESLVKNLASLQSVRSAQLLTDRYQKYRRMGAWVDQTQQQISESAKSPKKKVKVAKE